MPRVQDHHQWPRAPLRDRRQILSLRQRPIGWLGQRRLGRKLRLLRRLQPQGQDHRSFGLHLRRAHQHRAVQLQDQPRPSRPKRSRPQGHHTLRQFRQIRDPRPIRLPHVQDQPWRRIQHPHPPRHRLAQRKLGHQSRPLIRNQRAARIHPRQSGQFLRKGGRSKTNQKRHQTRLQCGPSIPAGGSHRPHPRRPMNSCNRAKPSSISAVPRA